MTESGASAASPIPPADARWWGLREELVVFVGCSLAALAAVQGLGRVPHVGSYAQELAELVFLLVPFWVIERRGERIEDHGFHLHHGWKALALAVLFGVVTFGPFIVGFEWWWGPRRSFSFDRLPSDFWNIALAQFLVVALPEEALFRGYLQTRFERRFPSRSRHGIPIGWAIPATSVLFAIGHFVVIPDPSRLAVFFPSLLFGLLRHWSGGLLAPILFHGACNVLGDTLYFGYFG
ncbi:MAG: CPBP family intramembrane metalloprotease [Deltaproteobacteria bacterium]|nr:CPBP family intramembrane metalloprotease [Deltaproteobacteria bacterium]